jgi:hypothetical protein
VADLDEALEIVSATPRSLLRHQLPVSWRRLSQPPTWLRALADGDREALTTMVCALRAFYLACVAPAWPEIAAAYRADVAQQAAVLARGGLGELFGALHPDLALRDGSLERSERALTRAGRPGKIQLEGQGLQILPSVLWTGPPLFSIHPPSFRRQRHDLSGPPGLAHQERHAVRRPGGGFGPDPRGRAAGPASPRQHHRPRRPPGHQQADGVRACHRAPEDDGYVMAFVHNPDRGAADLVILAAQDFRGEPVARVHLPARIPLGFHGNWIPDR